MRSAAVCLEGLLAVLLALAVPTAVEALSLPLSCTAAFADITAAVGQDSNSGCSLDPPVVAVGYDDPGGDSVLAAAFAGVLPGATRGHLSLALSSSLYAWSFATGEVRATYAFTVPVLAPGQSLVVRGEVFADAALPGVSAVGFDSFDPLPAFVEGSAVPFEIAATLPPGPHTLEGVIFAGVLQALPAGGGFLGEVRLEFEVMVVPEPGTGLLIAAAGLLALIVRERTQPLRCARGPSR